MATEAEIDHATQVLRAGGLVAFPTETVYGLGADAENPAAVARIFAAKGRPADHPLIVHLGEAAALASWAVEIPQAAFVLAEAFWPGPLTLVLRRHPRVPLAVTGGLETVGLRVPAHPVGLALLRRFGGGVAAPSANRFGRLSPTSAAHVRQDLGDAIDVVLDGGDCAVGLESTIVDLSGGEPTILRPGGVTPEMLHARLGRPVNVREEGGPRAPGRLPSHYAPRAIVEVVPAGEVGDRVRALRARGLKVGVLAFDAVAAAEPLPADVLRRSPSTSALDDAARGLYASLRALDEAGCQAIVTTLPDARGLGLAIADRLKRAAGPRDR